MPLGIFRVSDITPAPTTGRAPTEHERIQNIVTIAKHAEEVGLDVFALGEHHNDARWAGAADARIRVGLCWRRSRTGWRPGQTTEEMLIGGQALATELDTVLP